MNAATADRPKCMTPLAGKPLLEWQLEALHEAGVDDIAVVCGYKAEVIAAAPLPFAFQQIINPFWASSNMVSSLLCAAKWAKAEACLVSYSDIVYSPGHVTSLLGSGWPVAITYDTLWRALWERRFQNPLADAESFRQEGGRLLEIGKKAQRIEDIQGQYMGLIKVEPEGWEAVSRICADLGEAVAGTDMTTLIGYLLEKNIPVAAVPVAGKWCEVDNQNDLALYERLSQCRDWSHNWRE